MDSLSVDSPMRSTDFSNDDGDPPETRVLKKRKIVSANTERKCKLRAFMKFFTTSKTGLGATWTGAGIRDKRQQSAFRAALIKSYNAEHPTEDGLWCPISRDWQPPELMTAAHLFPYMHGQDTMDAMFGKQQTPELFSPNNGLLMLSNIEQHFDSGKLVIIPDLPNDATKFQILQWTKFDRNKREYKVKVLDKSPEFRNKKIVIYQDLTYGQLDNRRLEFRGSFRPAARYLYFHYCVQLLRFAWQHAHQRHSSEAAESIRLEFDKPVWATPGRYIYRHFLRALVDEVGHDYQFLLEGAKPSPLFRVTEDPTEDQKLLEVVSNQVKSKPASSSSTDLSDNDSSQEDEA